MPTTKSPQFRVTVSLLRFHKKTKKRIFQPTAEQIHQNQQPLVCNGIAQLAKLNGGNNGEGSGLCKQWPALSSGQHYRRRGWKGMYCRQTWWSTFWTLGALYLWMWVLIHHSNIEKATGVKSNIDNERTKQQWAQRAFNFAQPAFYRQDTKQRNSPNWGRWPLRGCSRRCTRSPRHQRRQHWSGRT